MTRKRSGQPGNRNAVGHGAPIGNKNAYKHGLYVPFIPMLLLKAGVSLDRYDEWFMANITMLGYTREELRRYRGLGSDGCIQLFMRNTPDGITVPEKLVVYRGKTVVFDSSECGRCDDRRKTE